MQNQQQMQNQQHMQMQMQQDSGKVGRSAIGTAEALANALGTAPVSACAADLLSLAKAARRLPTVTVMRVCSAKKCSSLATQTKANLSPNIKETFKLKGRVIKPVAQPAKVFGVSGASSAFRATRVN